MDYQTQLVREFHVQARQPNPDRPTIPSIEHRRLRAKLIFEEALETINKGLGMEIYNDGHRIRQGQLDFVKGNEPDITELADGCADLKVVTVGTEVAFGIDGEPIFREVMRSNMTKFKDGTVREDGKVLKGPHYEPPNIAPILREQGAEI